MQKIHRHNDIVPRSSSLRVALVATCFAAAACSTPKPKPPAVAAKPVDPVAALWARAPVDAEWGVVLPAGSRGRLARSTQELVALLSETKWEARGLTSIVALPLGAEPWDDAAWIAHGLDPQAPVAFFGSLNGGWQLHLLPVADAALFDAYVASGTGPYIKEQCVLVDRVAACEPPRKAANAADAPSADGSATAGNPASTAAVATLAQRAREHARPGDVQILVAPRQALEARGLGLVRWVSLSLDLTGAALSFDGHMGVDVPGADAGFFAPATARDDLGLDSDADTLFRVKMPAYAVAQMLANFPASLGTPNELAPLLTGDVAVSTTSERAVIAVGLTSPGALPERIKAFCASLRELAEEGEVIAKLTDTGACRITFHAALKLNHSFPDLVLEMGAAGPAMTVVFLRAPGDAPSASKAGVTPTPATPTPATTPTTPPPATAPPAAGAPAAAAPTAPEEHNEHLPAQRRLWDEPQTLVLWTRHADMVVPDLADLMPAEVTARVRDMRWLLGHIAEAEIAFTVHAQGLAMHGTLTPWDVPLPRFQAAWRSFLAGDAELAATVQALATEFPSTRFALEFLPRLRRPERPGLFSLWTTIGLLGLGLGDGPDADEDDAEVPDDGVLRGPAGIRK